MHVYGHKYGDKWQRALTAILARLARDEGHGLLVLVGPDGSGKTDMIRLVRELLENPEPSKFLADEAVRRLAEEAHSRRYVALELGQQLHGFSIADAVIGSLVELAYARGIDRGRRLLIIWDDIDRHLADSGIPELDASFFLLMHRFLPLYDHATFLVSVTAEKRRDPRVLPMDLDSFPYLQL